MIKRILVLLMLLVLTGCQLATKPTIPLGDIEQEIGVMFTLGRLDESLLSQDKIYATTTPSPSDSRDMEIEFEQIEGYPVYVFTWYDPDDAMNNYVKANNGYLHHSIFKQESENQSDKTEENRVVANAQLLMDETRPVYGYTIWQTMDHQVYIKPVYATPLPEVTPNTQLNMPFSWSRIITQDDDETIQTVTIEFSLSHGQKIDQLTLLQYDDQDQLLDEMTYPADQPPEEVTPLSDTAYLILKKHLVSGDETTEIYQPDQSSINWQQLHESGFLVPLFVPLEWPDMAR